MFEILENRGISDVIFAGKKRMRVISNILRKKVLANLDAFKSLLDPRVYAEAFRD